MSSSYQVILKIKVCKADFGQQWMIQMHFLFWWRVILTRSLDGSYQLSFNKQDNGQVNKYVSIGLIIKNLYQLQEHIIHTYFQMTKSLLEVGSSEFKTTGVSKTMRAFILDRIGLVISKERMGTLPKMPKMITSIILQGVWIIKTLQHRVLNFLRYQFDLGIL